MDRVVVKCPRCSLGHKLPPATQGEVKCYGCGETFHADTRVFDTSVDATVRDVGLGDFATRDMSFGRQPPPVATPIQGGGLKTFFGAAKGSCPHCSHVMSAGDTEMRCPNCDHYSIGRNGYLHPIPEDYVSPSIIFNVPMGAFERGELPAICCACGETATRLVKIGSYAQAPHCQRHSVGAAISTEEGRFGVRVKSHRFYCAAMMRESLRF